MTTPSSILRPHFISVALCTYNGARFLPLQLQSMLRQTRLPDELVAYDDGSQDETIAILERFAETAPFPVTLHRNATNLGSTLNFERAVAACQGEFIVLSDQDDIWRADRISHCLAELHAHPDTGLVFTDGEIVDDAGKHLGIRLWENFGFHPVARDRLSAGDFIPMARRRIVTGATVMFRARFREFCFPVGQGWVHDGWMAAIIASMSGIRMIAEPLIDYRQHSSQQIGLGPQPSKAPVKSTRELRARRHWSSFVNVIEDLDTLCAALDRLPLTAEQRASGPARGFYTQRDFLAMRVRLPEDRWSRLPIVLRERNHYAECAMGWLSMFKDLTLHKQGEYQPMWGE